MYSDIQFKISLHQDDKEDFCLRKQVELYYFLDRTKRTNTLLLSLFCEKITRELSTVLEQPFVCSTIDDCVSVLDRLSNQLIVDFKKKNDAPSFLRKKNMEQVMFYDGEIVKLWQNY